MVGYPTLRSASWPASPASLVGKSDCEPFRLERRQGPFCGGPVFHLTSRRNVALCGQGVNERASWEMTRELVVPTAQTTHNYCCGGLICTGLLRPAERVVTSVSMSTVTLELERDVSATLTLSKAVFAHHRVVLSQLGWAGLGDNERTWSGGMPTVGYEIMLSGPCAVDWMAHGGRHSPTSPTV